MAESPAAQGLVASKRLPGRTGLALRVWMFVVCGLAVRAFAGGLLGPNPRMVPTLEPVTIDINRAALPELQALPGVGRVRAEAIILYRLRHGPFRKVDDLDAVDGLGPVTVESLRPFVRV